MNNRGSLKKFEIEFDSTSTLADNGLNIFFGDSRGGRSATRARHSFNSHGRHGIAAGMETNFNPVALG